MRLIIAGCEYSGTTTLSQTFGDWGAANMEGGRWGPNEYHDHWKLPHVSNFSPPAPDEVANVVACYPDTKYGDYTRTGLTHEEQAQIMALSPKLKEMLQRYHLQYHLHPSFYAQDDHIMVGAHIDEGILGPIYFDYGGDGQYADRRPSMRHYEEQILGLAPDTILVLVTASAEVIRRRMKDNPHLAGALQDADVEHVLERHEEEYADSLLLHKTRLDTSSASIQESTDEIIEKITALMTEKDQAAHTRRLLMNPRSLGRSDVTVSPIGLGTGNWGREIDEDASWRVMDYAVEHGITFFDSGEVYGGGQSHATRKRLYGSDDVRETTTELSSSEKIIGRWLRARGCREEITLCTKVGTGNDPENIGKALTASLDRLGVDSVDMYKLHSPDDTPIAETLAAMTEEVAAGRTRAIGCSNFSAEQLAEALEASAENGLSRFDVIQPPYSLALPDADEDIFPICEREQVAVTSYSPLGAGFLTGKYTPDRSQFPEGSRYHIVPAHADIYFSERNFKVIELLREQAERSGTTMIRLALAWAMRHPAVTSILVGARNSDHIDNALAALDIAINDDLWTQMRNWPA